MRSGTYQFKNSKSIQKFGGIALHADGIEWNYLGSKGPLGLTAPLKYIHVLVKIKH